MNMSFPRFRKNSAPPTEEQALLPVPKLAEGKAITHEEFAKVQVVMPDLTPSEGKDAIGWTKMTPAVLTSLWFRLQLHKGVSSSSIEAKRCIFLPPNSSALMGYREDFGYRKPYRTCTVNFSPSLAYIHRLTTPEAFGNIETPFCPFAMRMRRERNSRRLKIGSRYQLSEKYMAPVGAFRMLPHEHIKVDKNDEGRISLSEPFMKAIKDTMKNFDASKARLSEVLEKLKKNIFDQFGDIYPQEVTYGVAAHRFETVRISTDAHLQEIKSYQVAKANAIKRVDGRSVSPSELSELIDEPKLKGKRWDFIGLVDNGSDNLSQVLNNQLISRHWAKISVRRWGSVVDLFPRAEREKLVKIASRYPSFVWKLGIDQEQKYALRNVAFREYFLTRLEVANVKGRKIEKTDIVFPRPPETHIDSVHNQELVVAVTPRSSTGRKSTDAKKAQSGECTPGHLRSVTKQDNKGELTVNDFCWVVVSKEDWNGYVALKNVKAHNKFLTAHFSQRWQAWVPRLRQVRDGKLSKRELFKVELDESGQGLRICWNDGHLARRLKLVEDTKKHEGPNTVRESYDKSQDKTTMLLFKEKTKKFEREDWGDAEGYHLRFVEHDKKSQHILWTLELPIIRRTVDTFEDDDEDLRPSRMSARPSFFPNPVFLANFMGRVGKVFTSCYGGNYSSVEPTD